jgi:uncharacterized damage-inducible protein DinB
MFAAYNRWANERIYAAAGALSPADFRADHGAFFGSLNGTLNHLVVTDRIWLRRFTGDGPLQTRLDEILTDDIASLHGLRRAEDARLIFYVDGPTEAAIAGPLSYTPISKPIPVRQPLGTVLAHLFNHQTHHRGQATAILTRIGGRDACESLDLAMFQRQTGVGL